MNLKRLFKAMVLPVVMLFALQGWGQTVVSGTVTGTEGQPLAGVSVLLQGTSTGTSTDANGAFMINAPQGSTLVFSYVGYQDYEWVVSGAVANIAMVQGQSSGLNEVVVVAYGTRRKSDLTGSVTAVTTRDFQKGNIGSSEQLLQGKVAGLEVTPGGGAAGGGSKIRIRGAASLNASNDPLIVVDGVPVESNSVSGSANLLNTINPNDIESMSVLKDASATALYGSRASNGVIIITTKKGTSNKTLFNFNTRASQSVVPAYVDVLSGDQIRQIVNDIGNPNFTRFLGTANTDWQREIYQNAFGWDNNISASGRAALSEDFRLPFRISAGYYTQEGVLKTNKFDRYSTSLNLNPRFLDDHLTVNLNAKFTHTKTRFADEGAIGSAVAFDPTQPVMSGDNKMGGYWEWYQPGSTTTLNGLAPYNPLALLMLRDNRSNLNRFIGNVQFDYKMHFLPDLHLLVNLGMDQTEGKGTDRRDTASAWSHRNRFVDGVSLGDMVDYRQKKTSRLADVQLFYEKRFDRSRLDVLVGHSFQDFMTDSYGFSSYYLNGTMVPGTTPNDSLITNGFAIDSYLGRLNYSYDDKYLFTATMRRDASSRFAKENRVGYFPSLAFAWKLNEDLFPNAEAINEVKLRVGWGITGQQDGIALNDYLPLYYLSQATAQAQFGDVFLRTNRPVAYNSDLQWETTTTTNIGLDFNLFDNRVSGAIDAYQKDTRDLLSVVDIAPGANFDIRQLRNIGSLVNKGIEFTLNTTPVRTSDFRWDFGGNLTYQYTEITQLSGDLIPTSGIAGGTGNLVGAFMVGYAPYTFYLNQQVYDAQGNPIPGLFEDGNRDGQISSADNRLIKKPAPDFLLGLTTGITYKDFTMSLAGHGMIGNYLYNNFNSDRSVLRSIQNPVNHLGNAGVDYLNSLFANNHYLSDYYLENASFFRLDNINLGYNIGRIANDRASLRLNASIQNVFVITKYSGADPESAGVSGVDNNIYPRPRIYSIGANIDF